MMFVDSFDKRSESFDGSPQPLAEESIAKTSTLNSIALSCQGGLVRLNAQGSRRRGQAAGGRVAGGWQEVGRV